MGLIKRGDIEVELGLQGKSYGTKQLGLDIAKRIGVNQDDVHAIIALIFELIKTHMAQNEVIDIKHFGRFYITARKGFRSNTMKNPEKRGTPYFCKRIMFKPAWGFKDMIYTSKDYERRRLKHINKVKKLMGERIKKEVGE